MTAPEAVETSVTSSLSQNCTNLDDLQSPTGNNYIIKDFICDFPILGCKVRTKLPLEQTGVGKDWERSKRLGRRTQGPERQIRSGHDGKGCSSRRGWNYGKAFDCRWQVNFWARIWENKVRSYHRPPSMRGGETQGGCGGATPSKVIEIKIGRAKSKISLSNPEYKYSVMWRDNLNKTFKNGL